MNYSGISVFAFLSLHLWINEINLRDGPTPSRNKLIIIGKTTNCYSFHLNKHYNVTSPHIQLNPIVSLLLLIMGLHWILSLN